jgi:hypothetical protein
MNVVAEYWREDMAPASNEGEMERPLEELVAEVMRWHRDPKSPDYNKCDKSPCAWCAEAAIKLDRLRQEDE